MLQPEATDAHIVDHASCQPVPDEGDARVQQGPEQVDKDGGVGRQDGNEGGLEHLIAIETARAEEMSGAALRNGCIPTVGYGLLQSFDHSAGMAAPRQAVGQGLSLDWQPVSSFRYYTNP